VQLHAPSTMNVCEAEAFELRSSKYYLLNF
jgi:hypothetical protein